MVKVNINFYILLVVSSSKRNVKLQTRKIKSCCYLAPKETLIYNEFLADWVTFTEETLNRKLHVLCSVNYFRILHIFFWV